MAIGAKRLFNGGGWCCSQFPYSTPYHTLQFPGHDPVFVSTKPAAAHCRELPLSERRKTEDWLWAALRIDMNSANRRRHLWTAY